jgi:hypothetical protein
MTFVTNMLVMLLLPVLTVHAFIWFECEFNSEESKTHSDVAVVAA